jgi:uncharacterized peroxidase-related enzyme
MNEEHIAWIQTVPEEDATAGELASGYEHYRDFMGYVSKFIGALSLRPTVIAPLTDFQAVLGFGSSSLGKRREEILNISVSALNNCPYCQVSHTYSLQRIVGSDEADRVVGPICNWERLVDAATSADPSASIEGLDNADLGMLVFAHKLTTTPGSMHESDIQALRELGFTDTNILDVVLLTSWRNFVNRVCEALGVEPESAERLVARKAL